MKSHGATTQTNYMLTHHAKTHVQGVLQTMRQKCAELERERKHLAAENARLCADLQAMQERLLRQVICPARVRLVFEESHV
jgi:hypothetical protein